MTDILSLTGKELEKELDRIIAENQQNYHRWTEKEIFVLKRLYADNVPVSKIAQILKVDTTAINNAARRFGVYRR